jgi:hypothetical protein
MATDQERETAPQREVQAPSLGRIVHYVAFGSPGGEFPAGKHRAALITNVYDQPGGGVHPTRVDLVVFNPNGYYFNQHVEMDPKGRKPGSWHWPELVLPLRG